MRTPCQSYDLVMCHHVGQLPANPYTEVLIHKAILKFLGLPEAEASTWRVKETMDISELSEMTLDSKGDTISISQVPVYCFSPADRELISKHKAILKFLGLPEAEAATWRVKETKDVSELSEMTLEEQGDFLINKIAVDFCEWLRELGGSEKSFINEEILKELFQIGMDNPASRALCIKRKEKMVLYYKLAEFLRVPKKSFQEVLSLHLKWDAKMEKIQPKVKAFGKGLPKNLQFKTPNNKTAETWLEWNKISKEQLSFADVYSTIKDLRSTKEYCKWLKNHPEHKRPQYLVDQGMFGHLESTLWNPSSDWQKFRLNYTYIEPIDYFLHCLTSSLEVACKPPECCLLDPRSVKLSV
ncbi:hypothetical protein J6590_032436 [Homalodisca vitripennis]|nr:hypothetical protein J6590_032436 [Homalodisca vitripennis]